MMRTAALVVLVGCGSAAPKPVAPAPAKPTAAAPAQAAPAAPDEPRVAFGKHVFDALGGGDSDALVKLADPITLYAQIATCAQAERHGLDVDPQQAYVTSARERFEWKAKESKGLVIAVHKLAADTDSRTLAKGEQLDDKCVTKQDIKVHKLAFELAAHRDKGAPVEQTVTIEAIETGGRWFFVNVERVRDKPKPDMKVMVGQLDDFASRMCKCTDRACAEQVQQDLTTWGTEASKDMDPDERPDEQTIKHVTDSMQRLSDCMTKLMTAAP